MITEITRHNQINISRRGLKLSLVIATRVMTTSTTEYDIHELKERYMREYNIEAHIDG